MTDISNQDTEDNSDDNWGSAPKKAKTAKRTRLVQQSAGKLFFLFLANKNYVLQIQEM